MSKLHLLNTLFSLAIGFGVAVVIFNGEPSESNSPALVSQNKEKALDRPGQSKVSAVPSGVFSPEKSGAVTYSKDWGVLPATLWGGLPLEVTEPGRLVLKPGIMVAFGITEGKQHQINLILADLESKVRKIEVETTEKVSNESGEYYRIPASAALRAAADQAKKDIRGALEDNAPAGEALLSALFHTGKFSTFGEYDEEISIHDGLRGEIVVERLFLSPENERSLFRKSTSTLNTEHLIARYPFFGE